MMFSIFMAEKLQNHQVIASLEYEIIPIPTVVLELQLTLFLRKAFKEFNIFFKHIMTLMKTAGK